MQPQTVRKEGEAVDLTLSANTQNFKMEKNVPQGLIRQISLHTFTTAFALGGGAAVTDGEKTILRSLSVKSDKHGVLYQNVDGKSLYRLLTLILSKAPAVTAVAAGGFACRFPIPLGFLGHLRYPGRRLNDTALWAFTTKPVIEGVYGTLTDVVTGGAPTGTVRMRPVFEYSPNPNPNEEKTAAGTLKDQIAAGGGDKPKWQIEVIGTKFASLSTTGRNEQNLPIGQGRIPLYVMLYERNASTDAEVSDIFTARTSKLELRHGSDYVMEPVSVTDLDEQMADFLNIASMPTGVHLIPMVPEGKILDSIVLDNFSEFKLAFDNCATAATRDLRVLLVNAVPVRAGANPEDQKA